jgi:hypothetical protein
VIVGQLVRFLRGPHCDRFADVVEVDGDGTYVLLRDVDERLADGRRRAISVDDGDVEPFVAVSDAMAVNVWSLQRRDLVEVVAGRDAGARGRLYPGPPGFEYLRSIHTAGDEDGQHDYVYAALSNLRPVTDRDPDPPPSSPLLPPLASLPPDVRPLEALARARAEGRKLTARELSAESTVNGRRVREARLVFAHDDLVAAVVDGVMSLRDAADEARRRVGEQILNAATETTAVGS